MYSGDYEPVPRTPSKPAVRPDDRSGPAAEPETAPVEAETPTAAGEVSELETA